MDAHPEATESLDLRIGPADHGRRMSLPQFAKAHGRPGHRYELNRGVVQVVDVPGLPHGDVLYRLDLQLIPWEADHPGAVRFHAPGDRCALRLPGMQSERHPDLALYLRPPPDARDPWERWIPEIVVEVVSPGGEDRDYEEKRHEYLAVGVQEYWIIDPARGAMIVLIRTGDVWREEHPPQVYSTPLLPGLAVDIARLFVAL
jgi:Uma2 family endonuclease